MNATKLRKVTVNQNFTRKKSKPVIKKPVKGMPYYPTLYVNLDPRDKLVQDNNQKLNKILSKYADEFDRLDRENKLAQLIKDNPLYAGFTADQLPFFFQQRQKASDLVSEAGAVLDDFRSEVGSLPSRITGRYGMSSSLSQSGASTTSFYRPLDVPSARAGAGAEAGAGAGEGDKLTEFDLDLRSIAGGDESKKQIAQSIIDKRFWIDYANDSPEYRFYDVGNKGDLTIIIQKLKNNSIFTENNIILPSDVTLAEGEEIAFIIKSLREYISVITNQTYKPSTGKVERDKIFYFTNLLLKKIDFDQTKQVIRFGMLDAINEQSKLGFTDTVDAKPKIRKDYLNQFGQELWNASSKANTLNKYINPENKSQIGDQEQIKQRLDKVVEEVDEEVQREAQEEREEREREVNDLLKESDVDDLLKESDGAAQVGEGKYRRQIGRGIMMDIISAPLDHAFSSGASGLGNLVKKGLSSNVAKDLVKKGIEHQLQKTEFGKLLR